MPHSNRNRLLPVRIPIEAKLEDLIDWRHKLLAGLPGEDPGERLLAAWRRQQGYAYLFQRNQIDGVLAAIPDNERQGYQRTLDWALSPDPAAPGPCPRKRSGRINWFCHSKRWNERVCFVNRFGWLVGLAAAARRDGRPEAAEAVFAILDDWLRCCPMPPGLVTGTERPWNYAYHPWGPLQAALRVKHWTLALHLLWDSPALTPGRFAGYVRSFRQHMLLLGRVSPRLWATAGHNHFLMETEALLYASLWPWLKESAAARQVALHNLARCIRNQILPDGAQIERAPGYHRGCMQWFALPLMLCKLNGWPMPRGAVRRLGSMLDFGLHAVSPSGVGWRFGDIGGGRDGYQSERLLAKLTGRRLPVAGVDKLPLRGLLPFLPNTPRLDGGAARPFALAVRFPHGGHAAARSSWRPDASGVFVKLDGYYAGHCHSDFFSFTYAFEGRTIIDETGTRGYDDDRASVACKLTAAHNVLLIGQREMCQVADPTKYWNRRPPIVQFSELFGRADKTGRLQTGGRVAWPDGAWWRRRIEFDPAGRLRVIDEVFNPAEERVHIQFHLASERVRSESPTCFLTDDPEQPNVRISTIGEPHPHGTLSAATIWNGHFNSQPATLLTLAAPPRRTGRWETVIEGV